MKLPETMFYIGLALVNGGFGSWNIATQHYGPAAFSFSAFFIILAIYLKTR